MSTTPFSQGYTAEHDDARRALGNLLNALDKLIKATDWRSTARCEQDAERDTITRKLRSLHSQAPGTALLWQRQAEQRLTEIISEHPELTHSPQTSPKTRRPSRRHRLALLLEDRKKQLALMKNRASSDRKQQISLEYNRTCNWLEMLDKMGVTKVSELWEQLREEDLARTFPRA
ncbi:MAG: hypothetical protein ACTIB1_12630 [Corynebacterium variabile]|uniref:hypothetical protein n=1 Tax=Corynebacterium variabile TaxID=1727 RepID=UPI003F930A8F